MFQPDHLNDAALRKYVREISAGEFLFKQGDLGNTMYIIVEGTLQLFQQGITLSHLVATLNAGEVVGEKAILRKGPYRRTYTAKAKTDVTLLELDADGIKLVENRIPDFPLKILRIATERLDKANELIRILQSPLQADRLVQYILYFSRWHSKRLPNGLELPMTPEEIEHTICMEKDVIVSCLNELVAKKILNVSKSGYVLTDENALLQYLPTLKERLAA